MDELKFIAKTFLLWRLLLFIPLYIGYLFLPYRPGFEYTNVWSRVEPYFPVNNFLFYPWANFDGVHYLSIAGVGYTTEARFFPLFPLLIRFISNIFSSNQAFGLGQFIVGFLIANVSFFLALIILYKLVQLDFSAKIAKLSMIFLLIFPSAFFFGSIYSESLFLLLLLLSFYFMRQRKWLVASFFATFLTITRPVGIVIIPVLIFEFVTQEKIIGILRRWDRKKLFKIFIKSIPLYFTLVGIVFFAWFNLQKWGNAFYFFHSQGEVGSGRSVAKIILFPQTLFRYGKILTNLPLSQFEWWIALLEILVFIFAIVLLYSSWKRGTQTSYLIFAILSFLIPASSGTFSALPRYIIVIFPIFMTLALIQDKVVKFIYLIASPVLLFLALMFFSRGYFIA